VLLGLAPTESDGVGDEEGVAVTDGRDEDENDMVGVMLGVTDGRAPTGARATPRNSVPAAALATSVAAHALVQEATAE